MYICNNTACINTKDGQIQVGSIVFAPRGCYCVTRVFKYLKIFVFKIILFMKNDKSNFTRGCAV